MRSVFAVRAVAAAACFVLAATAAPVGPQAEELVSSHGLSAFDELKYPADFPHFDYVDPDAPKGGRVTLRPDSAIATFDSFNPFILAGDPAYGVELLNGRSLIYDSLMVRAFDEPDALYGLVAERVETPPDRSYAIFYLRPEARFSDGSAVTAEDVVWSLSTLRDEAQPRFKIPLQDVADVRALDALTVRVDFRDGAPTRDLPAVVAQMPIFSKAFYAEHPFDEPSLEPLVGSGPYRIGDFTPGRSIVYERRPDYWAADLPVSRGHFNFGEIVFEYYRNHDAGFEAFKAGLVDFNEEFFSKIWATQYDFAAIQNGHVIKEVLPDGRPSGTQGFWINTRLEKFSDPRVREALGMAFDFEWSNRTLFYGLYNRTDSFFENSDLEAEGAPSAEEAVLLEPFRGAAPEAAFGPAVSPPVTNGSGRIRRQLGAAARLLDAAGWTVGADGVRRNAAGEVLEIEFLDRAASSFGRIVNPYIENLARLGIRGAYRQVDKAQYENRVKAFDFDVVTRRYSMPPTPGPSLKGLLSSESAAAPGSQNIAGVASPAIDALLLEIERAESRDQLRIAARALDRVFRAGHYWVPHWNKASHTVAYWDRFGRPFADPQDKPPYMRSVILTWWVDPAKAAAIEAVRGR